MNTKSEVRRSRKIYQCIGGPYNICNTQIRPGDLYFTFTLKTAGGHKTRRYCIECASRNHPDLLKKCVAEIKSDSKRRVAAPRVGKMSFLEAQSRYLKKNQTKPEDFLSEQLKKRFPQIHFRNQFLICGYIVDFWEPQKKLVIEIDGVRHRGNRVRDAKRDTVLRDHGIQVLRFPAQLVYSDMNTLLEIVSERLR